MTETVGSQAPFLIAIGFALNPQSVLELGSGLVSTPLFLDRRAFPRLERFETWDNQNAWAAEAQRLVEPRVIVRFHDGFLADAIGAGVINLAGWDLIFIDDGRDLGERIRTLGATSLALPNGILVAVHDFEHAEYRAAIQAEPLFIFTAMLPHMGLVGRDVDVDVAALSALDYRIAEAARDYPKPYTSDDWISALRGDS